MRHPFFWGIVIGGAVVYAYEHFHTPPKMPVGKYKK